MFYQTVNDATNEDTCIPRGVCCLPRFALPLWVIVLALQVHVTKKVGVLCRNSPCFAE